MSGRLSFLTAATSSPLLRTSLELLLFSYVFLFIISGIIQIVTCEYLAGLLLQWVLTAATSLPPVRATTLLPSTHDCKTTVTSAAFAS